MNVKIISFIFIQFFCSLLYAQDFIPIEWNLDVICGNWLNEKVGSIHCYEKKTNSFIDSLYIISDKQNYDVNFLFDLNFITYSKSFDILILRSIRAFVFDNKSKIEAGIGIAKYADSSLYMYYISNGYKEFPKEGLKYIPNNLKNKWNMRISLLDSQTREWAYRNFSNPDYWQSEKTFSTIYKLLSAENVIIRQNILQRALAYRKSCETKKAIESKFNIQKNAQNDIDVAKKFISSFSGKWFYKNIAKQKSILWDFQIKDSIIAIGIPQGSLHYKDYFYNKAISDDIKKYIGKSSTALFHPFPIIFYDWVNNRISYFKFSEFIIFLPKEDAFVFCASKEYFYCENSDIVVHRNIVFKDDKNQETIKWEISPDFTEIKEYVKVDDKWQLQSIMTKQVDKTLENYE